MNASSPDHLWQAPPPLNIHFEGDILVGLNFLRVPAGLQGRWCWDMQEAAVSADMWPSCSSAVDSACNGRTGLGGARSPVRHETSTAAWLETQQALNVVVDTASDS